ncbi:TolC family protein [Leeuwenhoekiella marinoflava]|uniref:Outer membrane protein TolC n=2 Tax=Leeuwenhoekiella marinoflava TaxID=988 RepID=A0A4Q0PK61_9FLAO|nr:TolC family protein [Leeuwenhoekiella marinoflava]RXG28324.1 outer membrane protein TolC [Leeuwenhoekiella marinoflava]SHF56229.1 Outer membrane protein TolC [Leeuwenhoekiella marinoflava DSM 3653]
MKNTVVLLLFLTGCFSLFAQEDELQILSFKEYISLVKQNHPVAKQAQLIGETGEAKLLKARGGFDPKVEVDFDQKVFKETEYYNLLNATFKIPTWYGIDLKAQFEQNDGYYLNPQKTVPENGLYTAGISASLGQGLWINERMATLKQAKLYREQTKADLDIAVNTILYDASVAYFEWLQAYKKVRLYERFLENTIIRFKGIKTSALAGDIPLIDTTEAKISVQSRELSLKEVQLEFIQKKLELSNFLWMGNNIPVELQPGIFPQRDLEFIIDETLNITGFDLANFEVEEHPKMRSLAYKLQGLELDRQFKGNKLLPVIDVNYNFITSEPDDLNTFYTQNYKAGLQFKMPLFLRKERGDLKLAQLKLRDTEYELTNTRLQLKNKILAVNTELNTLEEQNDLASELVVNYDAMLTAEERKYQVGESSIFLINSRELKLIDSQLKQIEITNKFYKAKAKLFKTIANNPDNL